MCGKEGQSQELQPGANILPSLTFLPLTLLAAIVNAIRFNFIAPCSADSQAEPRIASHRIVQRHASHWDSGGWVKLGNAITSTTSTTAVSAARPSSALVLTLTLALRSSIQAMMQPSPPPIATDHGVASDRLRIASSCSRVA